MVNNETIGVNPLIVDEQSFIDLVNQLKMAGDTQQSKAISELADKIDELTEQVRILNEHLSEQSAQKVQKDVVEAENTKALNETAADVRGTFMDGVRSAGKHIKEFGVKGVNKCFDFMHIRNGLERVRDLGDRMLERDAARVERVEERGEKFHRSAMHIKNAGSELLGNELKTEPSENGKITSALKKPIELKTKITKAIINGAEGAINKLDKFQAATEGAVPEQSQETSAAANNGEPQVQEASAQEPGVNQLSKEDAMRGAQMEQMLSPDMGM